MKKAKGKSRVGNPKHVHANFFVGMLMMLLIVVVLILIMPSACSCHGNGAQAFALPSLFQQ